MFVISSLLDLPRANECIKMFLNVGGAVLGIAILTAINDSVASEKGGKQDPNAALAGQRAGYYGAIAMCAIGFIVSIFFAHSKKDEASEELKSLSDSDESRSNYSRRSERSENETMETSPGGGI